MKYYLSVIWIPPHLKHLQMNRCQICLLYIYEPNQDPRGLNLCIIRNSTSGQEYVRQCNNLLLYDLYDKLVQYGKKILEEKK